MSKAANMCWVSFFWQLKRIQLHVMFKKVRQWHPDKCEQILKRNSTQSDILMAEGTVHLLPQVFRGYISGITHLCLDSVRLHSPAFACLSFFTINPVCLSLWSISFLSKKKKKRQDKPQSLPPPPMIHLLHGPSPLHVTTRNPPLPPFISTDS